MSDGTGGPRPVYEAVMKRTMAVLVLTAAAVSLLAGPASAKGISYAHFSGPGLPPGGVTFHRQFDEFWLTGLLELKHPAAGVPREDLGPAYRAAYSMDWAPRQRVYQIVYPYAVGGPVTFTPKGQHVGQDYESFEGGWFNASSDLVVFLQRHGLPKEAPARELANGATSIPASPAANDEGSSNTPLVWALIAGGVILAGVLATMRVRRRRPSA